MDIMDKTYNFQIREQESACGVQFYFSRPTNSKYKNLTIGNKNTILCKIIIKKNMFL